MFYRNACSIGELGLLHHEHHMMLYHTLLFNSSCCLNIPLSPCIVSQALWDGSAVPEDDEQGANDDLDARLANLDLGSGFF